MTLLAALLAVAAAPPPPAPHLTPFPGLVARSIGPATMGGRIPALAVDERHPATQYVATAGGGLWKTTDDGRSWACVFAGRPHASLGAVALAPSNPSVVYLGTGEANPRNSVSWGNGVFVSTDAGRSWRHAGLTATHHIGRIAVHPTDPRTAYVAALGHLWGPNPERGLFVTRDGGRTWEHTLKLDADTGCIDVVAPPGDPSTVFAAAYRVRRGPFSGGNPRQQFGPLAGIYRSRDAGRTWTRLTRGLPTNQMGRIGLTVSRRDPRLLFAVIQTDRTDTRTIPGQAPGKGPVEIGGIFVTRDGGDSWAKVNNLCPRPFYFGKLRLDPTDDSRLYVLGLPVFVSTDGGRTFTPDAARGVHVDHHELWIDPADSRHLILGNDGGLYTSRDRGLVWTHIANLPISQFYNIAVDSRSPYHIYGGLQDNGTWGGPSATSHPAGIFNADWRRFLGMDGFQCRVPPDNPNLLFAEGQYGRLHRIDVATRRATSIRPYSTRKPTPSYRFNWNSPLLLSPHDPRVIYYGGNHLFRSGDQGNTWRVLSPDLTRGGPNSPATDHTLTALAESPRRPGHLLAGSDDGLLHLSTDDGSTWTELSSRLPGLPPDGTVTSLAWSPHAADTAWVAITRHTRDDRRPHLYRTDDRGKTWQLVAHNLPAEGPIHVILLDEHNPQLVLVGTEFGLFASLDRGTLWNPLTAALPPCAVRDLAIQPRARELVLATHGRGLYILDIAPLQELTPAVLAQPAHLFDPRPVRRSEPTKPAPIPERSYLGANPPAGAILYYHLRQAFPTAQLEITTEAGRLLTRLPAPSTPGLHRLEWNLRDSTGTLVPPGDYRLHLRLPGTGSSTTLRLRAPGS
ncbi:MAG: hypothetical protein U0840_19425 [Gemmataceae bacterium]